MINAIIKMLAEEIQVLYNAGGTLEIRKGGMKMSHKKYHRTYEELFLDKLTEQSKSGEKFVGNKSLREALKWDEKRYERIKARLVDNDQIVQGRGRSGSVGLAQTPGTPGLSVFISYCHEDAALKEKLVQHLKPLERLKLIETWHDGCIAAGKEWEPAIKEAIEKADIILLMVSVNFINSSYCFDEELEHALERHDNNKAKVVPIIIRNCLWQRMPFGKLLALPKDGKAVVTWNDLDEAFTSIANGILELSEKILNEK